MRHFVVLAIAVAIAAAGAAVAGACAFCNIHNYLASSVRSSKDIAIAKVIRQEDESTALVEVTKVLRGEHKKGQQIPVPLSHANEYVGKSFIFSNPTSAQPNFSELPVDMEDEVKFLMATGPSGDEEVPQFPVSVTDKDKKAVTSVEQAIVLLQGVSTVSHDAGLAYIQSLKEHPSEKIIEAIAPLRKKVLDRRPDAVEDWNWCDEYRLRCLVQALLLKDTKAGRAFCMEQVQEFLKTSQGDVAWDDILWQPGPRAEFLMSILSSTGGYGTPASFADFTVRGEHEAYKDLLQTERQAIRDALPGLKGMTLAGAVYALLRTGAMTPDEPEKVLKDDESKTAAAAAFYWMSVDAGRDEAKALLEKASALARRPEARKAIEERLAKVLATPQGRK